MAAELTFYTIDDLRLGQQRSDGPGWRLMEFTRRSDAFRDYQSLNAENIKVLGVTNGIQALDLVRCVPVFAEHKTCEDVLVMDYKSLPFWCRNPTVKQLAEECIETFRIRYGLHKFTLFPLRRKPESLIAKRNFRLLNVEGCHSPIRWIYVAGVGWLSPEEFKRRYIPPKSGDFQYPLVMKYRVDAVNKDGQILLLEIAPRDLNAWQKKLKDCFLKGREPMNIDVKIYLPKNPSALLATASVCLEGCFIIRGVKVIEGSKTVFVSMPSRKVDEEYHDVCCPSTKEFRQEFDQAVLDAYAEAAAAESE